MVFQHLPRQGYPFITEDKLKNRAGTGETLALPLVCVTTSIFVFWLIRSATVLSMIKNYYRSLAESSANGMHNLSVLMILSIIYIIGVVGSLRGNVREQII